MAESFNDTVGIPSVGENFESHINTYGSKWQLGIAVDLSNKGFDYGEKIKLVLATDSVGETNVNTNETEFGVSALSKDINSLPSNRLQYGDKVTLGPSTMNGYEGQTEVIRISTAAQDQPTNSNAWSNGVIFTLDRKGRQKFQLGDPATAMGSGKAFAWTARNSHLATLGILKGYSSLGAMARYAPNANKDMVDHVTPWENTLGNTYIGLAIRLPSHASYDATKISGPANAGPLGGRGPAIFNATKALAPWRDTSILSDANMDWEGDSDASGTIDMGGTFRYTRKHDLSDVGRLAYNSNAGANAIDWGAASKFAVTPVLMGTLHDGGQYKPTAQMLFTMINSLSDEVGAEYVSTGILTQLLTRSINNAKDMSFAKLVPGTYYRFGITWKGAITPDAVNAANSQVFAKFQWAPMAAAGDVNQYEGSMLSTIPLIDATSLTQTSYKTDMVTGFMDSLDSDLTDETWDSLRIDIIMQIKSPSSWANARQYRGAEAKMFVDSIWIEHQGDIPNASDKGYVEIDHYPEQGTLQTKKFRSAKSVVVKTAVGQEQRINPFSSVTRELYEIEADFVRVNNTIWSQFQTLLEWQDMGYNLVLHPFLPEVPFTLIGKLSMEIDRKSSWDLNKHTFRLRFTEV